MNEKKITVGVINWFSADQIKGLFESLNLNASEPENIEFFVCDNTAGKDTKLADVVGQSCSIFHYSPVIPRDWRPQRASGSYAHGLGLNFLFEQINTEYCLITDPDCFVFMKGWDLRLKSLIDRRHIAAGAPYHCSKIAKYHNFPSPIFSFFKVSALKSIQADWIPYRLPVTTLIADQLRRIPAIIGGYLGDKVWGSSFYFSKTAAMLRSLFGNSSKDTGWRIASAAKKKGFSAQLLTSAVLPDQLAPGLAGMQPIIDLMSDYELFLDKGIPFVTHLYSTKQRGKGNLNDAYHRWSSLTLSVSEIMNNTKFK
jgi:hypothetical protein